MKVRVKLLVSYRRYLPPEAEGSAYSLEVPSGARVEEVLAQVPVPADESRVVLLNGRVCSAGQVLEEGDTITIFPALAGG